MLDDYYSTDVMSERGIARDRSYETTTGRKPREHLVSPLCHLCPWFDNTIEALSLVKLGQALHQYMLEAVNEPLCGSGRSFFSETNACHSV